jgi:tetratricopeptide (TPR) repeat protein
MTISGGFQIYLFYGLIILSFAINCLFLLKKFYAFFMQSDIKKRIISILVLLLIFSSSMVFFPSVTVRGGYDNNHDIEYLSRSFFDIKQVNLIMGAKEASPLITDGISDIISGFSLETILIKNRVLVFFSALILFALLLKLRLDFSAAILGFGLFYFNFLTILNANTFTTTSSNVFFFLSSLFALVCFQSEKKNIKTNIIWVLSAMFLVLTARYELFIVSLLGFVTVVGIYIKERKVRLDFLKAHSFFSVGLVAYFGICFLWLISLAGSIPYNGPDIANALNLFGNFKYQFIERNAAFFMAQASLLIPLLLLLSFFIILFRGLRDKEKFFRNSVIVAFLVFWIIYFSMIFVPLDLYPLHFMRHRFYFLLPFVILFPFAMDSGIFFLKSKWAVKIIRPLFLIILLIAYISANIFAVKSLQKERRTNDIELEFLSKAQKELANKYSVIYPAFNSKFFLLKKYFPFYKDCSRFREARYIKYLSPEKFIMKEKGDIIQKYHPLKSNYIAKDNDPALKISFKHKFYTMFSDREAREEIPIEMGFYYADNFKDRAWISNSKGSCSFKSGRLDEALKYFKAAVQIDPKCIVCAYNASATYAFLGREKEALIAIKNNIDFRDSYGAPLFERALINMASGRKEKAKLFLENFINDDMERNHHQNEIFLGMASAYLDRLDKHLLEEEDLEMENKRNLEKEHKNLSNMSYIKELKEIADNGIKKYKSKDFKGAISDFKKVIKIDSGNIGARITICSINLLQKDFDEALKYCDIAVNMAEFPAKHNIVAPGVLSDVLFLRAEIYANLKEYKKASLDLEKVLKKAPKNWKDFKKAGEKLKKIKKLELGA